MNARQKTACVLNALIFVLATFSATAMFVGFSFMGHSSQFTAMGFAEFKYFTVDSNVFAGIVSLVTLVYFLCHRKENTVGLPRWLYILKLAATAGVTLTMMVTVFFLAPTSSNGYFSLFLNSNLFMHFLIPVLCIVTFIFFERTPDIPLRLTLLGTVPMLLYTVFYCTNIMLHLENGIATSRCDWYGFLPSSNIAFMPLVIIFIALVTWGFSLALWRGNWRSTTVE